MEQSAADASRSGENYEYNVESYDSYEEESRDPSQLSPANTYSHINDVGDRGTGGNDADDEEEGANTSGNNRNSAVVEHQRKTRRKKLIYGGGALAALVLFAGVGVGGYYIWKFTQGEPTPDNGGTVNNPQSTNSSSIPPLSVTADELSGNCTSAMLATIEGYGSCGSLCKPAECCFAADASGALGDLMLAGNNDAKANSTAAEGATPSNTSAAPAGDTPANCFAANTAICEQYGPCADYFMAKEPSNAGAFMVCASSSASSVVPSREAPARFLQNSTLPDIGALNEADMNTTLLPTDPAAAAGQSLVLCHPEQLRCTSSEDCLGLANNQPGSNVLYDTCVLPTQCADQLVGGSGKKYCASDTDRNFGGANKPRPHRVCHPEQIECDVDADCSGVEIDGTFFDICSELCQDEIREAVAGNGTVDNSTEVPSEPVTTMPGSSLVDKVGANFTTTLTLGDRAECQLTEAEQEAFCNAVINGAGYQQSEGMAAIQPTCRVASQSCEGEGVANATRVLRALQSDARGQSLALTYELLWDASAGDAGGNSPLLLEDDVLQSYVNLFQQSNGAYLQQIETALAEVAGVSAQLSTPQLVAGTEESAGGFCAYFDAFCTESQDLLRLPDGSCLVCMMNEIACSSDADCVNLVVPTLGGGNLTQGQNDTSVMSPVPVCRTECNDLNSTSATNTTSEEVAGICGTLSSSSVNGTVSNETVMECGFNPCVRDEDCILVGNNENITSLCMPECLSTDNETTLGFCTVAVSGPELCGGDSGDCGICLAETATCTSDEDCLVWDQTFSGFNVTCAPVCNETLSSNHTSLLNVSAPLGQCGMLDDENATLCSDHPCWRDEECPLGGNLTCQAACSSGGLETESISTNATSTVSYCAFRNETLCDSTDDCEVCLSDAGPCQSDDDCSIWAADANATVSCLPDCDFSAMTASNSTNATAKFCAQPPWSRGETFNCTEIPCVEDKDCNADGGVLYSCTEECPLFDESLSYCSYRNDTQCAELEALGNFVPAECVVCLNDADPCTSDGDCEAFSTDDTSFSCVPSCDWTTLANSTNETETVRFCAYPPDILGSEASNCTSLPCTTDSDCVEEGGNSTNETMMICSETCAGDGEENTTATNETLVSSSYCGYTEPECAEGESCEVCLTDAPACVSDDDCTVWNEGNTTFSCKEECGAIEGGGDNETQPMASFCGTYAYTEGENATTILDMENVTSLNTMPYCMADRPCEDLRDCIIDGIQTECLEVCEGPEDLNETEYVGVCGFGANGTDNSTGVDCLGDVGAGFDCNTDEDCSSFGSLDGPPPMCLAECKGPTDSNTTAGNETTVGYCGRYDGSSGNATDTSNSTLVCNEAFVTCQTDADCGFLGDGDGAVMSCLSECKDALEGSTESSPIGNCGTLQFDALLLNITDGMPACHPDGVSCQSDDDCSMYTDQEVCQDGSNCVQLNMTSCLAECLDQTDTDDVVSDNTTEAGGFSGPAGMPPAPGSGVEPPNTNSCGVVVDLLNSSSAGGIVVTLGSGESVECSSESGAVGCIDDMACMELLGSTEATCVAECGPQARIRML